MAAASLFCHFPYFHGRIAPTTHLADPKSIRDVYMIMRLGIQGEEPRQRHSREAKCAIVGCDLHRNDR